MDKHKQMILAVDDDGNFTGEYIPKEVGHTGNGRRHLAVTVLLYNSKGEVLLQKRKHKIFDNIWDFTASTHPLHKPHLCHPERLAKDLLNPWKIATSVATLPPRNDKKCRICNKDNVDETLEEATLRALKEEYGIGEVRELREVGEFNYFALYRTVQGELCENEHDHILVGEYNGEIKLNPEAGYEYKWVDKKEVLKDIEQNPQNYTPWAIKGVKVLKQTGFFN